jgi:putative iron-dependent peroxidase
VLSPLTAAAIFLVVTVNPGGEDAVRELLPDVPGLERAVGFRSPDGDLAIVAAIGSDLWDRLFSGPRPAELHPFTELSGPRHRAPATPGDLLFHIRANRMDLCFEFATQVMARLADAVAAGTVAVADEVHGFRYFDKRDIIGFVDGTESPTGSAGSRAAFVGSSDPSFAGGSYVIVQKYLHDMPGWNALPTEDQERAIGRTKLDDIELPDAVPPEEGGPVEEGGKPPDSHVALNTLEDSREIVRVNMPFGDVGRGEFGTYFIGYAASPEVTEEMLRNMFLGRPPGVTDRILDFSTAVTGGLFFAPPADFFDDLPDPPAAAASSTLDVGSPDAGSLGVGSLDIGSLKGEK